MTIGSILKGGFSITSRNFLSLIGAVILYLLTIWIPYLNVGTTIAMLSLPAAMSRGEAMSPTEIFNAKYRENMGNYFLLIVFHTTGILIGYLFGVIPGIVMALSWSLAFLLVADKGLSPTDALTESNRMTNGHKWTMFFAYFVYGILFSILYLIILVVVGLAAEIADILAILGFFFYLIFAAFAGAMSLGMSAQIYRELSND